MDSFCTRKSHFYSKLGKVSLLNETKEKSLKQLEMLIEYEEKISDYFDADLFKKKVEKQDIVRL